MTNTTANGSSTSPHKASASEPGEGGSNRSAGLIRSWILIQGHNASVTESADRPSSSPNPGDPIIEIEGPFASRAHADARLKRLTTGRYARAKARLAGSDR